MAQFVVVAITLIGIYYQFRLQRAASTFEQINRLQEEWGGPQQTRAKLAAARAIHQGQLAPLAPASVIGNFCEAVASLIRHGHVNTRAVYETMGPSIIVWWVLLEDTVKALREREHDPTGNIHFEWLARAFLALASKDQVDAGAYGRSVVMSALPEYIRAWEERITIVEGSDARSSPAVRRRKNASVR